MNCKPGELAYVIRSRVNENLGRIVQVTTINTKWTSAFDQPVWNIIPRGPMHSIGLLSGGIMNVPPIVSRDCHLCPIRDPGEDAQDESTAWLPPIPTKEIA